MKTRLAILSIFALCGGFCFAEPYPVAAFFQPVRNLDAMKAMGINTIAGPEVENSGSMTPAQLATARDAWIKATADRGLKVVLKNPPPTLPAHCVGVMLSVDEPNGKGVKPSAMKAESDAYRAKYPGVLIFLSLAGDKVTSANFNRPDEAQLYKDYVALADVLTVDCYSMNRNATRYPTTWTGEAVKKLALVSGGRDIWAWTEINDQRLSPPPAGQGVNRAPTPDEIKATWEYAVKSGAKGIGAFLTCDSGKYGWPASYFPQVDRDGKSMQPQYDAFKALALAANPAPAPLPSPVEIELAKVKADLVAAQVEVAAVRGELDQAKSDTAAARSAAAESDAKVNAARAKAAQLIEALNGPQPPPTTQPTKPAALLLTPSPESAADGEFGNVNWGSFSIIDPGKSPYETPEQYIRAYARACRPGASGYFQWRSLTGEPWGPPRMVIPGAPTVLDFENYYDPNGPNCPPPRRKPSWTQADAARRFALYLTWFRDEAPGVPVSVIGYPYYTAESPDGATYKPVNDLCDFNYAGWYMMAREWRARDEAVVRADVAKINLLYPGKPMFFSINPALTKERTAEWREGDPPSEHRAPVEMTRADALPYWAFAKEMTPGPRDQRVIYCDLPDGYAAVKRVFGGLK